MTDPYNSYQTYVPAAPVISRPAMPPPTRDNISKLDVSEKWKSRFRSIENAGGPDLPHFRKLPMRERRAVQFNWSAFFFGPFYFLAKGLWRQAIVYLVAAIACVLIMDAIGLDKLGRAVGYGFAAVYGIRANVSYYKKIVLGEAPWA